jgi:hypothetical protein
MIQKFPQMMLIAAVLLAVTWLGARGLNADSIWFDEGWSIYNAGGALYGPLNPLQVWERVAQEDPRQSPGYPILLNLWGTAVGWSAFAARTFSLLAGVLAVATVYRLTADLLRREQYAAGLVAAAALGAGGYFVVYLHDIRAYSLQTFAIALCALCYWRLVFFNSKNGRSVERPYKNGGDRMQRRRIAFAASVAFALYAHYFSILHLAILAAYHLLFAPKTRGWWQVYALMLIGGLTLLPSLPVLLTAYTLANTIPRSDIPITDTLRNVIYLFSSGSVALLVLLALSGIVGAFQREKQGVQLNTPSGLIFVLFWLGVWGLLAALLNERLSMYEFRYWLPLFVPLAALVGIGGAALISDRPRGIVLAAIIAGVWIAAGVFAAENRAYIDLTRLTTAWLHQPAREVAAALNGRIREGDVVLYHSLGAWSQERPLEFYLYQTPARVRWLEAYPVQPEQMTEYETGIAAQIEGAGRVWLAAYNNSPLLLPDAVTRAAAGEGLRACGGFSAAPDLTFTLYVRETQNEGETLTFGEGDLMAAGRLIAPLEVVVTSGLDHPVLSVVMLWEGALPSHSVAIHVADAGGNTVAQTDAAFTAGCMAREVSLAGLPAGEYRALAAVYDWQTQVRLNAGTDDDRAEIGTFVIP